MLENAPRDNDKTPLVKGTSVEEEIREILDRVILLVSRKESSPRESEVSSGRSNQSIIYHHTIQNQTCCFTE